MSSCLGKYQVRVNNTLNVTITGVGSVYYKGDPAISSIITGLGKLADANWLKKWGSQSWKLRTLIFDMMKVNYMKIIYKQLNLKLREE